MDIKFTTRRFSTGAPFTLAGSPIVVAYPDNGTTEITAGITLTIDFDGKVGLNNVRVVATTVNGFIIGTNYALVLTSGSVDGVSVVGEVVGAFSIENRSALTATTPGRTLAINASGNAGIDWANVSQPSAAVDLSDTTIGIVREFDPETGLSPALVFIAVAGTFGTITLPATATSVTDFFRGSTFVLIDGTGTGQSRVCNAYDGATKIASISPDLAVAADDTTRVAVFLLSADSLLGLDLQARLPTTLIGGRMNSNVEAISNEAAVATALHRGVRGNVLGTVGDGSTTLSIVTSSLDPAATVSNQFKDRSLVFTRDTLTSGLRGQAKVITASTSGGVLTLDLALSNAPVSSDTFVIV